MKQYLIIFFILCVSNLRCQTMEEEKSSQYFDSLFKNKFNLREASNFHIGNIQIDSGVIVSQIFDKKDRQNPRLYLANMLDKKELGIFTLPGINDFLHFSSFYSDGFLFYNNDTKSIKAFDINKRIVDTFFFGRDIKFLTDFIVSGQNLFSIQSVSGITVINIRNPSASFIKSPYKGSFYYGQNNISVPVSNNLNLISSINTINDEYILYAVDSGLNSKWEKTLNLKNRNLEIKVLNLGENFLIKYDNILELISKNDGKSIWSKSFEQEIMNLYLISDRKVVVILARNLNNNRDGDNIHNILQFDILNQQPDWNIELQISSGNYFVDEEQLLFWADNGKCKKIELSNGNLTMFECDTKIRIISDKITGKNYLLSDSTLYW